MAAMTEDLSTDAVVEGGWQAVHDDGRVRAELLEAAYAEPRLRHLFPWTGMGELHFSRCTEQRWTWDIPYIQPAAGGTYLVSGPDRTQTVGPAATAQEAVAMVVERLPPGSGPAFVGTPEQLAAHGGPSKDHPRHLNPSAAGRAVQLADRDHDCAQPLLGVDLAVGGGHLGHRVDPVDNRLDLTGFDHLGERGKGL